jgi:hypothetical protein
MSAFDPLQTLSGGVTQHQSPFFGGALLKSFFAVVLILSLCGCSDDGGGDYEASLDCAANESFTTTVVLGIRDISEMSEDQRKFSTALLTSSYVHARSAGVSTNQAHEEINRRGAELVRRFQTTSSDQKKEMKMDALEQSTACARRFALVSS